MNKAFNKKYHKKMIKQESIKELKAIPDVGKSIANYLLSIGITSIANII